MTHKIQTDEFQPTKVPGVDIVKSTMESAYEMGIDKGRAEGMGYMVAEFLRVYGEHPGIVSAWRSWKMTVAECRKYGVAEYDQEVLDKYESILDK